MHPTTPVALNNDAGADGTPLPGPIAAFDVGGTFLNAGLVHPSGRITHRSSVPTSTCTTDPAGSVISQIVSLADNMPGRVGVGVVVPGIVDTAQGVGVLSANLGWRNAPFCSPLHTQTGLPVGFHHDVTAAALAEATYGAARGTRTFAMVVIGTGIAAGLYIAGNLYRGNGYAGEIGHTVIDPTGPPCPCGARGCLEQFASAAAIARRYTELSGIAASGSKTVVEAKRAGDIHAEQAWNEAIDALASGLRQLAATIAPDTIVIGGGLQRAQDDLFLPLREAVSASFTMYPAPAIVPAECGPDAGLLGAALLGGQAVTKAQGMQPTVEFLQ